MTPPRNTWAEDLYEAAQELGLNLSLEQCQQQTLKGKAEAAEMGLTEEQYMQHKLLEFLHSDEGEQ